MNTSKVLDQCLAHCFVVNLPHLHGGIAFYVALEPDYNR